MRASESGATAITPTIDAAITSRPGTPPRKIAVLSVHTSPAAAPGSGDAGGMNVYIRAVARELARQGVASDLYTRATGPDDEPVRELEPGVRLLHLPAGPVTPVGKERLPGYLPAFLCSLLHAVDEQGPYDLVHSHYWLSGWVGRLLRERRHIPLAHSFHTLGRVKNAGLAPGEAPEPTGRLLGEERVAAAADVLVAPTALEAAQLVELYGAPPTAVEVVSPGVDLSVFQPGDRAAARRSLGVRSRYVLVFAGRLQPLKAPDVAVRALVSLCARRPDLDVELLVVGGVSGNGSGEPERLRQLAAAGGVADRVRLLPPRPPHELAQVYRAADLLLMPSRSESFGLVALEAQACGTPVLATRTGGLSYAVGDGTTGILVDGHDPVRWAQATATLLDAPRRLAAMRLAAAQFSRAHGWDVTAGRLLDLYQHLTGQDRLAALERTS